MQREVDAICKAATPDATTCSSCEAPIFFVTLARTRASHPLDLEPSEEGTVLWPWGVNFDPDTPVLLGLVLRKDERAAFADSGDLYRSHFETCPNAEQHRKAKGRKTE